jgi:hypothetical protein
LQITGVAATLRFPIADIEEAADAVVAAMGGPVGGEPATARVGCFLTTVVTA